MDCFALHLARLEVDTSAHLYCCEYKCALSVYTMYHATASIDC
jgi:hypothetical protein